ncbi:MAG: glycoside hydrolase family 3 C-terminal domain-containing protein [Bacteroidota bacterium]
MNNSNFISYLFLFTFIAFTMTNCESPSSNEPTDDQKNQTVDVTKKIEALIGEMTIEEKVSMIHASSSFTSGGVERLNIPELTMSDGPHGVRHEHGRDWTKDTDVMDKSTYLPVGISLASTWNTDLGYEFGKVLGSEANYRGKDIILGPGFNIQRSPLNGRNFEYLSEDPYLNSRFVVGYIKGVQEQGIAACAKHYIANTLEYQRQFVDVLMDERAFREIYLPAYVAAVQEADVQAIMGAYNKFRGTYCTHHPYLLDQVLRKEIGFNGIVMSDWKAVKDGMEAINTSLDIEMGTDLGMLGGVVDYGKFFLGDTVVTLVKNGTVKESLIDDKVRRILGVMFKINKFGERSPGAYNTKEHQAIARKIADESIVLLKNEQILPLDKSKIKKLAVVGDNATRKHAGAGGSSQVKAFYEVTPLEGLQNILGEEVTIDYAPGYEAKREAKANAAMIADAVKAVSGADVALYIGGYIRGYTDEWDDNAFDAEEIDKPDMMLPFGQDALIEAVLKANPNTIVVLIGGGPVDMRAWETKVKGIIQAGYPGMETGNALAGVLFGEVNPSGKLPMTFPKKLEDSPAHSIAQYPDENLIIDHKEGIFVGYLYFDKYEVEPAFAFGHGLSYTTFDYSDLSVEKQGKKAIVKMKLTNSGEREGKEVVQLYVKDVESALERPNHELKSFQKVNLQPGESKVLTFELGEDAFSYYHDGKKAWELEAGKFELLLGSSSRDIRLTGGVTW